MSHYLLDPKMSPQKTVTLHNLKNIDRNGFIHEIASSSILNTIPISDNVYTIWNLWKTDYLRKCNTFAPIQQQYVKNRSNPWFNSDLL